MTKRMKNKQTMRRGNRNRNDGSIVFRAKTYNVVATTSGVVSSAVLFPGTTFDAQLYNLKRTFGLYRFEHINVTLYPVTGGYSALSYTDGTFTNAPTTLASMGVMGTLLVSQDISVPVRMRIGFRKLVGENANKWWRSSADALTSAWDEYQGTFFYIGSGQALQYTLDYTIRFSNPSPTVVNPQPRRTIVTDNNPLLIDAYFLNLPNPYIEGRDYEEDLRRIRQHKDFTDPLLLVQRNQAAHAAACASALIPISGEPQSALPRRS